MYVLMLVVASVEASQSRLSEPVEDQPDGSLVFVETIVRLPGMVGDWVSTVIVSDVLLVLPARSVMVVL